MYVAFVGGVRRKGDIVWKDECIDENDEEVDIAVEKRVVVVVVGGEFGVRETWMKVIPLTSASLFSSSSYLSHPLISLLVIVLVVVK